MQEYGEFWERLEMEYEIEQLKNKKNEQTNEIKTEYKPIQTQMEGIPHKQTNEEWFCDLSTEKKAEVIAEKIKHAQLQYVPTYGTFTNSDWWEKWLKEKHET